MRKVLQLTYFGSTTQLGQVKGFSYDAIRAGEKSSSGNFFAFTSTRQKSASLEPLIGLLAFVVDKLSVTSYGACLLAQYTKSKTKKYNTSFWTKKRVFSRAGLL